MHKKTLQTPILPATSTTTTTAPHPPPQPQQTNDFLADTSHNSMYSKQREGPIQLRSHKTHFYCWCNVPAATITTACCTITTVPRRESWGESCRRVRASRGRKAGRMARGGGCADAGVDSQREAVRSCSVLHPCNHVDEPSDFDGSTGATFIYARGAQYKRKGVRMGWDRLDGHRGGGAGCGGFRPTNLYEYVCFQPIQATCTNVRSVRPSVCVLYRLELSCTYKTGAENVKFSTHQTGIPPVLRTSPQRLAC